MYELFKLLEVANFSSVEKSDLTLSLKDKNDKFIIK